jgi:hypothetical protein
MLLGKFFYHILSDPYVVGPDLLLEAKTLELADDGAQILNQGIRIRFWFIWIPIMVLGQVFSPVSR